MPYKSPQKRGEKIVRVGAFERTMQEFNNEMAQKVASSIGKYHIEAVEPRLAAMERRLEWIDTPWYQKLWIRTKDVAGCIWARIKAWREKKEPEKEGESQSGGVRAEGVLQPGDPVETSEVGDKLFEGEHQIGIVTDVDDGKVSVIREGEDDPMVYSPSVWQLQATPAELEAEIDAAAPPGDLYLAGKKPDA